MAEFPVDNTGGRDAKKPDPNRLSDAETRAELNRLLAADESDLTVDDLLKLPPGAISLLRLLAESQQALREIIEGRHTKNCSLAYGNDPSCECYLEIAKNAIKGGK